MEYFNRELKVKHLALLLLKEIAKDFIASGKTTEQEKKYLKKIIEYEDKFSGSVFGRLGNGYTKSISNMARENTLRICYKNSAQSKIQETIEDGELQKLINDNYDIDCSNCNKEDCLKCGIYQIKSYLSTTPTNNNGGCPFKIDKQTIEDDDLGDWL